MGASQATEGSAQCVPESARHRTARTDANGLARGEALSGAWDEARERLRPILAAEPKNFGALCVLAYVEAQLQDLEVAADLYRRALEVRDYAVVRKALAQLHP